jgi:hypothetical protein
MTLTKNLKTIEKGYSQHGIAKVEDNTKLIREKIEKGYKLQLNSLEFPIHYNGELNLDE